MQGCLHGCKHPAHEAIFNRPMAYAAGVPERGFFRCRRKRMARLVRDMRKCASYIFLDERLPFRCWEIVALYIFFGLVEHLRRRQNFYDIMAKKRFRHAAALVCKTENVRRKETGKCPS